jgi:hypothetical protein
VEIDAGKVLWMRATSLGSTVRSRRIRGGWPRRGSRGLGNSSRRSRRSSEPDRGHHAGAGAPESVGHGEAG